MTKSISYGRKRRSPKKSNTQPTNVSSANKKDDRYAPRLTRTQRRFYTKWADDWRSKKPFNDDSFNPSVDVFDPVNLPLLEKAILGSPLFREKCSDLIEGKKWASAVNEVIGNTTFISTKKGAYALSGLRGTAGLAAELAREDNSNGMAYCNYYCGGIEGSEKYRNLVLKEMKRMGWDLLPPRDLSVTVQTNPFILEKLKKDDDYTKRFMKTFQGTLWEKEDSIFSKPEALGVDEAAALVAWARNESSAEKYKIAPLVDKKDVVVYSDVESDLSVTGYSPVHKLYPTVQVDEDPDGKPRVSEMCGGMDAYLKLCEEEEH